MRLPLFLAAAWLAATPAAAGVDPELAVAAVIVARHHVARPPVTGVPTGSVAEFERYLRGLDPYSRYLTREQLAAQGALTGLGALVTDTPDGPLLVPLRAGPAYRAGLRHPLVIHAVDARPTATAEELGRAIAGRSHVHLHGRDMVDMVELSREVRSTPFEVPPVEPLWVAGRPVLRLNLFVRGRTADMLRAALAAASSPVVVDLRYAGGGDLLEAVDAASLLLPPQATIATTRDAEGREVTFRNDGPGPVSGAAVVLLIGPQTASAAEIFARALVHHGRARAAGRTTRGKCMAQRRFPLPNGDALELSVTTILDPEGVPCGGTGLAPTVPFDGNIHDTAALLAVEGPP